MKKRKATRSEIIERNRKIVKDYEDGLYSVHFQGKMWYNAYRATGKTKYQKSSALHIVSLMWGLTPHSKKEK